MLLISKLIFQHISLSSFLKSLSKKKKKFSQILGDIQLPVQVEQEIYTRENLNQSDLIKSKSKCKSEPNII